jgi:GTPase
VLLTDTIRFISRLPAYDRCIQINLEESLAADLILLLIDCSEDQPEHIRIKYSSCWELKVDRSKVFVIISLRIHTQKELIKLQML